MKSLENENKVISVFDRNRDFTYQGWRYHIITAGKPRVQKGKGEPKTDIYLLFRIDHWGDLEVKITLKQKDFNFMENKVKMERFEAIVGEGNGAEKATMIAESVMKQDLDGILESCRPETGYIRRKGEKPCTRYTLGYRLDITNQNNGKRSFPLGLTLEQKMEVFSGAKLEERKRDAIVCGKVIKNSGVANVMLEMDLTGDETPQEILAALRPLSDETLYDNYDLYGTLKAVNYYTNGKYEHSRPLVLQVRSNEVDGELRPEVYVDRPLLVNSTEKVKENKETYR